MFRAATPSAVYPPWIGVRVSGNAAAFVPRVQAIAAEFSPMLRVGRTAPLADLAWKAMIPQVAIAATLFGIVGLGLCLSAFGIFSLMSVSIARRTREIGLRTALGARPSTLLLSVFCRAALLVGAGIVAGNVVLAPALVMLSESVSLEYLIRTLAPPSAG